MFVFVIRYEKVVDGSFESGTFDMCYVDEESASKALVADYESTMRDWGSIEDNCEITSRTFVNDDGLIESACIEDKRNNDNYTLFIDKVEVLN